MSPRWLFPCLILLMLAILPATAIDQSQAAAAQVMVTNVTLYPQIYMVDDSGTITIEIINNGGQSVAIRRATLYDEKIRVESRAYETTMYLGAGNRMSFTFTVSAPVPEGIYYPVFSLDFRDGGYLRYPVKLQVQNQSLTLAILSKPDIFSSGKKETIDVLVGNPRDNAVSGVTVYPVGEGIDATPSRSFIGLLEPDQSQKVSFQVTPTISTLLEFHADYFNGINPHTETIQLPIGVGQRKVRAEPILSNIRIVESGTAYTLTGDVTNAGLEPANAVVITMGEGAVPEDPYRQYAVGTLQPDDFSGFELTFSVEGDKVSVPVVITHKDSDGNLYTTTVPVDIPASSVRNTTEKRRMDRPCLSLG